MNNESAKALRIRTTMVRADMTPEMVADQLHVSRKTFYRRLNEPGSLSGKELEQIGRVLAWSPADLWAAVMGEPLTIKDINKMSL